MSFVSPVFLILFLPLFLLLDRFSKEQNRNALLLALSLVFYAWCGVRYLLLLLLSAALAYGLGIGIESVGGQKKKTALLVLGLAFQLGLLIYYKYLLDFLSAFFPRALFAAQGRGLLRSAALPLGISFYTFSILSYLLDVYLGACGAQRDPVSLFLYVAFFPKVVQGPTARYASFERQLQGRAVDLQRLNRGMERFVKGMFKKVMIADQLQGVVGYVFTDIYAVGTVSAWLGILTYMLQLYYDFSGYSDMAIGLGAMAGFSLPENFDHPYMASSVAEYWRRWHISLGEWFRDYVYKPCFRAFQSNGWIRKLKKPTAACDILALIVTWTLTGIWHGSGLNYLIYGLWFCLFIVVERLWGYRLKRLKKQGKIVKREKPLWQRAAAHAVTLFAVLIGMIFFRESSVPAALEHIKRLFVFSASDGLMFLHLFDNSLVFTYLAALVFVFPVYGRVKARLERLCASHETLFQTAYNLFLIAAFVVAFSYASTQEHIAFLYEIF